MFFSSYFCFFMFYVSDRENPKRSLEVVYRNFNRKVFKFSIYTEQKYLFEVIGYLLMTAKNKVLMDLTQVKGQLCGALLARLCYSFNLYES